MRIRKYGRHAVLMRKARQRYRKNGAKLCSNERGPVIEIAGVRRRNAHRDGVLYCLSVMEGRSKA